MSYLWETEFILFLCDAFKKKVIIIIWKDGASHDLFHVVTLSQENTGDDSDGANFAVFIILRDTVVYFGLIQWTYM